MSVEFSISNQYLLSNRKKGFVSFISGICIIGLMLSVMALITVLSVMNGFHKELKDRILDAISHAYITEHVGKIDNWQALKKRIDENPHVLGSSPYIEQYALASTKNNAEGVSVRGVLPKLEDGISSVLHRIKLGTKTLDSKKNSVLIGYGLATKLRVGIGDTITLLTPRLSATILGVQPRFKRFIVAGIFDAGINEYDNNLVFTHLHQTQKLYSMKKSVSGIRLKVDDLFKAKEITSEIVQKLGNNRYYGIDWTAQKSNFIKALNLEKQMMGIILSLIIAIATFNIVSMMVMVVTDKKADIAILRTMGMVPSSIVKIFFYQGLTIGILGIILGVILGIILSLNIESIISSIESLLDFQFFPKGVFYINRFPSEIHASDIFSVVLGSFILVILAAIYPAKRASKVNIAKVLSYE